MSHTPGPWNIAETENDGFESYVVRSGNTVVCHVDRFSDEWIARNSTSIANAIHYKEAQHARQADSQLIASVPDLLKALRFYANPENWEGLAGCCESDVESDAGRIARDAIRKATGQTL